MNILDNSFKLPLKYQGVLDIFMANPQNPNHKFIEGLLQKNKGHFLCNAIFLAILGKCTILSFWSVCPQKAFLFSFLSHEPLLTFNLALKMSLALDKRWGTKMPSSSQEGLQLTKFSRQLPKLAFFFVRKKLQKTKKMSRKGKVKRFVIQVIRYQKQFLGANI